ncbi:hypothetical protein NESM_000110200 [Novymonas esmeraldas]|uniref:RNA-editing substrate-binding complex 6 protein domain-containing protein n=1 Tax=Novymonas esmeraldas TaxID=1808958 RepID=A0AAW0F1R7_9TRYP
MWSSIQHCCVWRASRGAAVAASLAGFGHAAGQQRHSLRSTAARGPAALTCSVRCCVAQGAGAPAATGRDAGDTTAAPPQRVSRFVRSNAAPPPSSAEQDGSAPSTGEVGATGAAPHSRLPPPSDLSSATAVASYLRCAQSFLRHKRNPEASVYTVHYLGKLLLPAVKGMDAATVLLLLQTLRMADASPTMPLVQDIGTWLRLHCALIPFAQVSAVVELLVHFNSPVAEDVAVKVIRNAPLSAVNALSPSHVLPLLAALLPIAVDHISVGQRSTEAASRTHTSLHSIVERLRRRCDATELLTLPAVLEAQVVRAYGALKRASPGVYGASAMTEWRSFEATVCRVLSTPDVCASLPITEVVATLSELVRQRQERRRMSTQDAAVEAAQEALADALVHRLSTAAESLRAVAAGETGAASTRTASTSELSLPEPWTISDVAVVWPHCVACATTQAAAAADGDSRAAAYAAALATVKAALLQIVSARFHAAQKNAALVQLMAFMCSELVVAWLTEESHTRENGGGGGGDVEEASAAAEMPDLTRLIPAAILDELLDSAAVQLQHDAVTWTPQTVRDVVLVLGHSRDPNHRDQGLELARRWYRQQQKRAQDGERVQPLELLGFFVPALLREEKSGVAAAVKASLARWSVAEVLSFFSELALYGGRSGGAESLSVLRESGKLMCAYVPLASASQLTGLVECFGAAQVRSDEFCDAVAARMSEILTSTTADALRDRNFSTLDSFSRSTVGTIDDGGAGPASHHSDAPRVVSGEEDADVTPMKLSLTALVRILRSLALMEARQTAPFLSAATPIINAVNTDNGTAEEVTQLIAAYAKMLIWHYPVLCALTQRLLRVPVAEVSLSHLLTAQLALLRMDVSMPAVTGRFYEELGREYPSPGATDATTAVARRELSDMVVQLSTIARLIGHPTDTELAPTVVDALTERIVAGAEVLTMNEVSEVLLSLARLGRGRSTAFERLTVRTLGMLPKVSARTMANVVEAYALAGRGDDTELFTLVADRTLHTRHEVAAVTIASVLASFAKAGVRNDRLFIEVIPRVRHVATYGTPRDVVNVVSAYATVNLWHYRLFARLADRAIQLRADFRTTELVALLKAYATVQMRYDRLFTEFAPRIQTLVHLFSPAQLASLVSSFAAVDIRCTPVNKACAAQATATAHSFSLEDARTLLESFSTQGFLDKECVDTLTRLFPELASIPWESAPDADVEGRERGGDSTTEGEAATREHSSAS